MIIIVVVIVIVLIILIITTIMITVMINTPRGPGPDMRRGAGPQDQRRDPHGDPRRGIISTVLLLLLFFS